MPMPEANELSTPAQAGARACPDPGFPGELRSSGLKATGPRLRILQLFHEGPDKHVSAEDLYRRLLDEHNEIALATIYRVLMQFTEAGILIRHHFDPGSAVFELNQHQHHDHMVCSACGKVEEFADPEIESRQENLARQRGFTLREHTLSLYGICADCARDIHGAGEAPRRGAGKEAG
jgi:Fur family transcriptional regulator, ferric uptake regulator